ncbi:peptide/nickel transport system permease protein [Desulfitispora alkaliphila]|uniref:ABC transporter permease n=1 Tax=Desulfitispora alkaliphila TaxID=622674 RepID=UPI003D214A6B
MKGKVASNYIIAFAIILILNFTIPRLMPGDPFMAIYGEEAVMTMSEQMQEQLRERMAVDDTIGEQFIAYVGSMARADLGYSYYYKAPVIEVILGALPWTLLLVGTAIVLSTLIGAMMGIESGWRRGSKWELSMLGGLMLLNGMPDFFMGIVLLLVFSVGMGIFPMGGGMTAYADLTGIALLADVLLHLALPVTALTLVNITGAYFMTRNTMIATISEPYITTAKAKGLSKSQIRYKHAGKNSLMPLVTRTGMQLGRMVTGAMFVEIVFSYPGLGTVIHTALYARDYPVMQGVLLVVALFVLVFNYLTDLSYRKIDPRVKNAY